MSFQYSQLEDDSIDTIGSVQVSNRRDSLVDQTFCPQRPLLEPWPVCIGILEIIVGFVCAGLGAVYIFLMPMLLHDKTIESPGLDPVWALNASNSFGAAVWSGFVLILAGSLAIRASKWRTILNVQHFYLVTSFGCLFNLSMVILILWSYTQRFATKSYIVHDPFYDKDVSVFVNCNDELKDLCLDIEKYTVISLLAAVSCVLGCMLLATATIRYFMSAMFGEVHLVKSFVICCFPCLAPYCKLPPSKSSSHQSVASEEPNMIV